MNNSNLPAEARQNNQNSNLLVPSLASVQVSPFYKCTNEDIMADTSESSGDIFKVGNVKVGEDQSGKAVYADVYTLAKPFLMKLATAAGIQFVPHLTTVVKENDNTYVGRACGAIKMPDGLYKYYPDTKRICLDDEEARFRLEFMDKSIMGIKEWKAANDAAKMFKGEWREDPEKPNQWGKPEKYYVIADCDREKYIARSVLANMTKLRQTASEKAQTGAALRVIRALLGIKGTYRMEELKKPFVVPLVTFSPNYSDPYVQKTMLQQGMNSMCNLFGSASMAVLPPTEEAFVGALEMVDVENSLSPDEDVQEEENWFDGEMPPQEAEPEEKAPAGYRCENCGKEISENVYQYSIEKFGKPLCIGCQRGGRA